MPAARYVNLTAENLETHHLCCALGDPKHRAGVERKRAWLRDRFAEGLVFRKLDARGKAFIEYAPGETAWRPVIADGWLVIHCLWVSGQLAGKGHARALLRYCLADAKRRGKAGVAVVAARTKRPFLADPGFFRRHGFEVVDEAGAFVLLGRRLREGGPAPRLADPVKEPGPSTRGCFVGRHTDQCPFNAHWAPEVEAALSRAGHAARTEHVETLAGAKAMRSPLGAYGLERDGTLVCHHLLTEGGVARMLQDLPHGAAAPGEGAGAAKRARRARPARRAGARSFSVPSRP